MTYLVGEMLVYLIGAFALGTLITWLVRGMVTARRIAANDELWIKEAENRRRHMAELEAKLAVQTDELVKAQHDLEAQIGLATRLEEEAKQARSLQEALAEARGKISELRPLEDKLRDRDREARMAEREVDLLRARVDDLNAVIHEQQAALDAKNEHVVKLCRQIEQLEPLSAELQLRNLTIAELQARLRKSERERKREGGEGTASRRPRHREGQESGESAVGESGESDDKDDLKRISGIGPVLERLLNNLGCTHYEQIANWTYQDIERIDEQLEGFRGRIRRDHWVEQAKALLQTRTLKVKQTDPHSKPVALARR